MTGLIASTAFLLLVAAPAQLEPPEEVLQVRINGKGDWAVRCAFQDSRGKAVIKEARPGTDRLHLNRPASGTCTYRAAPDRPMTIRLKSALYRCSLPGPEPKTCQQTFPAGTWGQFQIQSRD